MRPAGRQTIPSRSIASRKVDGSAPVLAEIRALQVPQAGAGPYSGRTDEEIIVSTG